MDQFDFINRSNADYIDRLQQQYQADPRSVEPHWRAFFAGFEAGSTRKPTAGDSVTAGEDAVPLHIGIADLVHSYRELGHFIARIDPLGHNRPNHPLLELSQFDLGIADLDRQVGSGGFLGATDGTLRDLIAKLRLTYCQSIGVEYMSISDKSQREWIQQRIEPTLNNPGFSAAESQAILYQLVAAQGFEEFLHTRFVGQKRFSLEGAESLIPLLNTIIDDGASLGVDEVVMGMAHRGRLNVLAHVMNKPYEAILSEFEGTSLLQESEGDGDVKYHLGYSQDRATTHGRQVHVALSFNPSHLELVNPVVEGIVRAKQYAFSDIERTRVIPLLMHGDAAFTGQGIVQECLGLSEMPFWRTGGTIHVIINNQIGFTTMPKQGRFTPYPTDIAKTIQAPIFHVNADDPEAVVHAARLAIAFRQQFHCDVMIDLWSYRRHGHNEVDEPSFTQPLMYKQIGTHPPIREVYSRKLLETGRISEAQYQAMTGEARARLEKAHQIARETPRAQASSALKGAWKNMIRSSAASDWSADTRITPEQVRKIADAGTRVPAGFTVHPKLRKLLENRRNMGYGKMPIDWGCGEMLALGSLILEGTPVRFVGQDAQRGTFSHRHACLHDYETGEKYYPLASLADNQADVIIVNTMLSELAVLGFEYGFSSADPRNLCVWEAQFGDFVNGAQAIIDQFITAAESKWQKMSGLVMLLPHGYDGQGPEHSNGYLERFLGLCAEDNVQVCYPTLPSQIFHLIRRQMVRNFRKPLIVMVPKNLLRSETATSTLADFTDRTLQLVIDDPTQPSPHRVKRILLCTGKIFYALNAARLKEKVDDVAIVRVEQLYPFPQKEIQQIFARYRNASEVCWVQEEPRNRGAWRFMHEYLGPIVPETQVFMYIGREDAASPATGSYKLHMLEEEEILAHALDLLARREKEASQPAPAGAKSAGATALASQKTGVTKAARTPDASMTIDTSVGSTNVSAKATKGHVEPAKSPVQTPEQPAVAAGESHQT